MLEIDENNKDAQIELFEQIMDEKTISEDIKSSFWLLKERILRKSQKSKKIFFLLYAQICFDNGEYEKGKQSLEKSIELDCSCAIFAKADFLMYGRYGYEKNPSKAFEGYRESCMSGVSGACQNMYFSLNKMDERGSVLYEEDTFNIDLIENIEIFQYYCEMNNYNACKALMFIAKRSRDMDNFTKYFTERIGFVKLMKIYTQYRLRNIAKFFHKDICADMIVK